MSGNDKDQAKAYRNKYFDRLDALLDRPIAYNPAFKRITGSAVAGIFLSQAWYWTKRHDEDDGWFWKTQEEWEEETGLTRYEQETARKHCLRVGVIEEKLKTVPAKLHYRVIRSRIYELLDLAQYAETPQTEFAETPQTENGETPQTGLGAGSKFAATQQSGSVPNINKNSEIPPMIPSVNDRVLEWFDSVHENVFSDRHDHHAWPNFLKTLQAAQSEYDEEKIVISGLGPDAEVYQSKYARSFERAFIGIFKKEIEVRFLA